MTKTNGLSWEELQTLKESQGILERLAKDGNKEIYQSAAKCVENCVDRWETKP